MTDRDRCRPASLLPMADDDHPDHATADSVMHVSDVLDSAAARLPEDHPEYPVPLRMVLYEFFSTTKLGREGIDRTTLIAGVRAVVQLLHRFESRNAECMLAWFLSLESALMALDKGVVEPLLKPMPSRGRGWNSMDREVVVAAAVMTVHHLQWAGLTAEKAHSAVAKTLRKAGFRAARGSRQVIPRTVRYWCAQVAEDVGQHTEIAKFVKDMLLDEYRAAIEALPPEVARKRVLSALETFLKVRCSAVLKKDS